MPPGDPWARSRLTAADQHGRLSYAQLRAAGLPGHVGRTVRARGGSIPLRRVIALPGAASDHEGACWEAVLMAGAGARLTGCAALALAGLRVPSDIPIAVLLPHTRRVTAMPGLRIIRTRQIFPSLPPGVLPVAPMARCITDAAIEVSTRTLRNLISTCLARRLLTLHDVDAEVAARRRFPGRPAVRRAIAELRGEVSHSGTERRLRAALRRRGLRPHHEPLTIRLKGVPVSEPDIPFPEISYGAQVDGPHHDEPDQAARDRIQDRQAAEAGWHIERFSVDEIDDDVEAVAEQIARTVDRRARLEGDGDDGPVRRGGHA